MRVVACILVSLLCGVCHAEGAARLRAALHANGHAAGIGTFTTWIVPPGVHFEAAPELIRALNE